GTAQPKVFVHDGIERERILGRWPPWHSQTSRRMVNRTVAAPLAFLTIPGLVVRPCRHAVVLKLGEDAVRHIVQHREDLLIALLPTGQRREARIPKAIHPPQVSE